MREITSTTKSKAKTGQANLWVLAATIIGSSMAFIDGTIIIVALPIIQTELNATVTDVQWIVEAYVLFMAALMLVGGSMGDRFGRRLIYSIGVILFGIASVWAGLSQNPAQLISSRILQGIGAALLIPNSLAILSAYFSERERGKAIGTWSGFTAITTALGPVVGGWLVENISWRWAFYINIPFALVVLLICFWKVPESRDENAPSTLDWWGTLLATVGLGGLVYGFIEMSNLGWSDPQVLGTIILGAIALVWFVFAEAKSPDPLMPLHLFRSRSFSGANWITLFLYAASGGFFFFLPFNLIQVQSYSPTASGAVFLPMILVIFVLSRWAGGLVSKYGAKWPLVIGSMITAGGFALFIPIGIGGSYWLTFFPPMVVLGLGMAISVPPLTTVVMNAVDDRFVGIASGINNAISRAAGLLAIAIFGVMALTVFNNNLNDALVLLDVPPVVQQKLDAERNKLAEAEIPDEADEALRTELEYAIDKAFVASFRWISMICAVLSLISAIVAVLMMSNDRIEVVTEERQAEVMF
ncbi:MAG: MFS transporter [Chloroflexota bacterium]